MTNDGIERILKSSENSGKRIGMCEMNLGSMEAQQFIIGHMDEFFQLMKKLKYQHMGELVKDLLGEGLLEIRSRAVQIEEHERSEKDCLWQDACE